jgi:hypothetical protein
MSSILDDIFGLDPDHSVDSHHDLFGDHGHDINDHDDSYHHDDLNQHLDSTHHLDGSTLHPHDDLNPDSHVYDSGSREAAGSLAFTDPDHTAHDLGGDHLGLDGFAPHDLFTHDHDSLGLDADHSLFHLGDHSEHHDPADHSTMLGSSNGSVVSFHGSSQDDNHYNYEYYSHQAQLHKESAERYGRDADNQRDLAERNVDNPDKVHSYTENAEKWASKAQSELQAYQDDINKANTYKD